ncbi:class I SAM-dependent methyltransferase [Saccharopolyspora sp. K220]|uniref:class I SAM-dependent methyltransferase n=1 Tax=Saccharopolyspora soli TaxID=2926618 RepID=UPI001F5A4AB8|nr:class I SAM-dependent methyltransferase [Saccharopolyspora soli]MCI2424176.1 class I SAM-dependent methyltransferase [Saccharopolyspora soli]
MHCDPPYYDWLSDVSTSGFSLVRLLNPQPGEQVLDVSCRTGELTAAIADQGSVAKGVCGDPGKIDKARSSYPHAEFEVSNAYELAADNPYDAVFCYAALHWLPRPEDALASVHGVLRPGGRFVAEMGAAGNWTALIDGLRQAADAVGLPRHVPLPWHFPTAAEQAALLESAGFRVRMLECLDRSTPMVDCPRGAEDWWRTVGSPVLAAYPSEHVDELLVKATDFTRATLMGSDGTWHADGTRLRFVAEAV